MKKIPGFTTLQILTEIQNMVTEIKCEPEHFQGRIIFMSMFHDIVWGEKGNKERSEYTSQTVVDCARRFPRGHWSFLGSWIRIEVVRNSRIQTKWRVERCR